MKDNHNNPHPAAPSPRGRGGISFFLKLFVFLVLIVIVVLFVRREPRVEKTAFIMGTPVRIKATGRQAEAAIDQAFAEMKRLEGMFDWKNPDSAINNIHPYDNLPDIKKILDQAEKVKEWSSGAFNIKFNGQLNLGGIGKGYAVEKARQLLVQKGIKNGIIDMRSSIAVIGSGWKIGILDPRTKETEYFFKRITLQDGESLATSGQYERAGHIIDPRTGKTADKCMSVTVVAQDAGLADALSTAIFVLGPEKGANLLEWLDGAQGVIVGADGKVWEKIVK